MSHSAVGGVEQTISTQPSLASPVYTGGHSLYPEHPGLELREAGIRTQKAGHSGEREGEEGRERKRKLYP